MLLSRPKHFPFNFNFVKSCRQDFDDALPDLPEQYTKQDFKPALGIYQQALRLFLIWRQERDSERLSKFCRYIVASLDCDSPKFSYVGVGKCDVALFRVVIQFCVLFATALNKVHVIRWISHMNNVLWKCCECLKELRPELANDMKLIILYLHVLVAFTSTNTWIVLKNKNMEVLKSGMNQLCANLMGQLFHKGFYLVLKV